MNRRTALRAMGAAISLPFLESMAPRARASSVPASRMRLAYLYIPNGAPEGTWRPARMSRDGQLLELNRSHAALEPFKSQIIVPNQIWTPRGNGHMAGTATWLTGGGYDRRRIDAGGASVDQVAARALQGTTAIGSLQLSMPGEGYFSNDLPRNTLSWTDARTPASRESSPRLVYDRLFRRAGEGLVDRSVLDLTLDQARALKRRIGREDQTRVDAYLEAVRATEKRIEFAERQAAKRGGDASRVPFDVARPSVDGPSDHGERMRLMFDLMALAFWSEATRVGTFMLDHGQSNRYFNFVDGVQGTWHALSHYKDISGKTEDDDGVTSWGSVGSKRSMYDRVIQWHHEQVAHFLGRLQSMDDGTGSLLDNSMIVYGSSLADGHEHGEEDLPVLIAGGGAGALKTGRALSFERNTSMSKIHLTGLRGLGIEAERFGETDRVMEELG